MSRTFILRGHEVVEVEFMVWARWFETHARIVRQEWIPDQNFWVSTVFLGLDHSFSQRGAPLIFETMVFGPDGEDTEQFRYSTWAEAEAGHQAIVARLKR